MRDTIKSKEYFNSYIIETASLIKDNDMFLRDGNINQERIKWNRKGSFDYSYSILIAKYSAGESFDIIKESYCRTLETMLLAWHESVTKVNSKDHSSKIIFWNQYMVSPYSQMLQMLSLGFLLDIGKDKLQSLVDIIDRDSISDNLYEFIIKACFSDRVQKRAEEYDTEQSVILKVYDKLRKAIETTDKIEASKLLKQFLEKDFYHKHADFYGLHNKKYNAYYGYWSFEAAAVVKIMGLNDSTFIDNQYYPKDLVHQPKEPPKKLVFTRS